MFVENCFERFGFHCQFILALLMQRLFELSGRLPVPVRLSEFSLSHEEPQRGRRLNQALALYQVEASDLD